ncbi:hypothetical protein LWI28_024947 [Acer negundo]|uniref:Uncharacterized protein n=1 Tax=Acer negundo TaxID=4023 RepID=A0AAD5IHB1_ACENE|nr:hypothetical protein LWI28_024947 [Acer negundo]
MKTRKSKPPQLSVSGRQKRIKKVTWNFDDEITKVIEKGREIGVDFKFKPTSNREDEGDKQYKGERWILEEEVTKVIETGAALGIVFNGREAEIIEFLSSGKREDEASFNVGLGKDVKRRKVKRVVKFQNLAVLFIQETKRDVFDSSLIRSIGGSILTRGVGVEVVGSAGGLMTLWDEDQLWVSHCMTN